MTVTISFSQGNCHIFQERTERGFYFRWLPGVCQLMVFCHHVKWRSHYCGLSIQNGHWSKGEFKKRIHPNQNWSKDTFSKQNEYIVKKTGKEKKESHLLVELDCSQSPIFSWDRRCQSLFDGPPSWSLDASETGESTKCQWAVAVGFVAQGWGGGENRETVTASHCLVFAALVASATATAEWSKGQ